MKSKEWIHCLVKKDRLMNQKLKIINLNQMIIIKQIYHLDKNQDNLMEALFMKI